MDNLFAWAAIFIVVMITFPFFIVAYVKRQHQEPYPLSPKAEKRLFLLKLLVSESMLGLWCYPFIVHIFIGDRSLVEIMNWQNTPPWALPVFAVCGGVNLVAIIVMFAVEMYKSYRGFKLRRGEQRTGAEVAPQISVLPDNE